MNKSKKGKCSCGAGCLCEYNIKKGGSLARRNEMNKGRSNMFELQGGSVDPSQIDSYYIPPQNNYVPQPNSEAVLSTALKSSIEISDDHAYYNILIPYQSSGNPYGAPSPAVFQETRTEAIIKNPSEYHMSIIRFAIPTAIIPIQVVPIVGNYTAQTVPNSVLPLSNNNPQKMSYSITLSYNGTDVQVFVPYVSQASSFPIPNLLTPTSPNADRTNVYYYLYSYQNLLDCFNSAFATAYANSAFAMSPPVLEGAPAPFFIYDPTTELVSLYVSESFNSTTNTILIYMNIYSNQLFNSSFNVQFNGYNAPNGKVVQIKCKNDGKNVVPNTSVIPPDIINPPSWNALINYAINDGVLYSGSLYYSRQNNNLGNLPTNATYWTEYVTDNGLVNPPLFVSGDTYNYNDFVIGTTGATGAIAGQTWLSIANDNKGNTPSAPSSYWTSNYPANQIPSSSFNYLKITQEYNTLIFWNTFKRIKFITGSVPVVSEASVNLTNLGTSSYSPILTDFEPLQDEGPRVRTIVQYFPSSEYRLIELQGVQPLYTFNLSVFWEDNMQQLYPLYIPFGEQVSVKVMFRKKSVEKKGAGLGIK